MTTVRDAAFFGLPPFAPLARAAAALASLVRPLFARPPFRPSATAAGFLRRRTGIVLVALHGQLGETFGDLVHRLPIALLDGVRASRHQLAAAGFDVVCCVCHAGSIPYRFGFVKWVESLAFLRAREEAAG